MRRRLESVDASPWQEHVDAAVPALVALEEDSTRSTVLHADLYRENVLFELLGHPRLIDPLPMEGDAASTGPSGPCTTTSDTARTLAWPQPPGSPASPCPSWRHGAGPWPWIGLLFYLDTGDPRAPRMADALAWLSAPTPRNRS
ncbi:hypothetical protein GCM10023238_06080 [Streptomyces heliomycini]